MNTEQICNSFFVDNKQLASKVLLSYQRQQPKNVNESSLINYILNSKEFIQHFNSIFDTMYGLMVPNNTEYLENMKKMFLSIKCKEKKGFSKQDIQVFIKEQEGFETYYTDVIRELYDFYFTDNITTEDRSVCFAQIKSLDFKLNLDMEKKIESIIYKLVGKAKAMNSKDIIVQDEHKQYFVDLYKQHFKQQPKHKDLLEVNNFLNNRNNIIDLYFESKYNNNSVFYIQIVDMFNQVFHRDITVFEYVKYYNIFSANSLSEITQYYNVFMRKFNIVLNIYSNYINSKIDHITFIKGFLNLINLEENEFEVKIIDIVVDYDLYRQEMCKKIESIYMNMYDRNIIELDKEYFFKNIHSKKVNLIDESLQKMITELKDETEQFEDIINKTFQNILQRCTDRSEMDMYIAYFRYPTDHVNAKIKLEDELYESLEYHDVLKDLIMDMCKDCKLNKSLLFGKLNIILKLEDKLIKRNKEELIKFL